MYGKLIEGELYRAPKWLPINNMNVWNPPKKRYLEQGWKEVVYEPAEPPEGYYFEEKWVEKEVTIEIERTLVPIPDEISDEEAFDIIFGGGD